MNESIDLARQRKIPFRVNRGQEIDKTITVNDANGSFDFTGFTAELFVYNSYNTDDPVYVIAVTLSTGTMRFTRAAINSRRENLVYKLWVTDDQDYRQVWLNGDFFVLNSEYDHPEDDDTTITISPDGDDITLTLAPVGTDLPLDIKVVTGTTYTVLESDNGKMIHYTSNSGVTITLPNGLSDQHITQHVKKGTGDLTFAAAGTLQSSGDVLATQYTAALAIHEGSNVWGLYGNLT